MLLPLYAESKSQSKMILFRLEEVYRFEDDVVGIRLNVAIFCFFLITAGSRILVLPNSRIFFHNLTKIGQSKFCPTQ